VDTQLENKWMEKE